MYMSTKGGIETEVKFRIADAAEFSETLRRAGAKLLVTGLERNIKYDRNGELAKKKELLRLRSYADGADITHKRRPPSGPAGFKTREETVVMIESFEEGRKLLERLGYEKVWIYEKKRAVWELGPVEVMVDEMPLIGCFIEIEGEPGEIRKAAGKLGLDMKDASTTTYGQEYESFRKEKGLPRADLVFRKGKG
jgi:predicted adenylyl cyclase CyaB